MKSEWEVIVLLSSLEDNHLTRTQQYYRDQILGNNIPQVEQVLKKAIRLNLTYACARIEALLSRLQRKAEVGESGNND